MRTSKSKKELQEEKEDRQAYINLIDDKMAVVLGTVVIALVGMWKLSDPTILLTSVVSGLFGLATGKSMNNRGK